MSQDKRLVKLIENIRNRMYLLGYNQLTLAQKSNISASALNKILHLKQKISVVDILKIAEGLDVDAARLFEDIEA